MKMSKVRTVSLGVFTSLIATVSVFGANPPANRISEQQAREIVAKSYSGKIQEGELEYEGGHWIYSFDLKQKNKNKILEVQVDAVSGRVVNTHSESAADERKEAAEDKAQKEDSESTEK